MKFEHQPKRLACDFGNMVLLLMVIIFFISFVFLFLVSQGYKPNVNVILLEDLAAVLGVTVAATAMGLSVYLQSPIPDAIGSLIIGGILGGVASFIIYSNTAALVGR